MHLRNIPDLVRGCQQSVDFIIHSNYVPVEERNPHASSADHQYCVSVGTLSRPEHPWLFQDHLGVFHHGHPKANLAALVKLGLSNRRLFRRHQDHPITLSWCKLPIDSHPAKVSVYKKFSTFIHRRAGWGQWRHDQGTFPHCIWDPAYSYCNNTPTFAESISITFSSSTPIYHYQIDILVFTMHHYRGVYPLDDAVQWRVGYRAQALGVLGWLIDHCGASLAILELDKYGHNISAIRSRIDGQQWGSRWNRVDQPLASGVKSRTTQFSRRLRLNVLCSVFFARESVDLYVVQ